MENKAIYDLELPEKHVSSGNYQDALDCYKNCLEVSSETSDQKGIRKVYSGMAFCYSNLNMYAEAIECYEKYLTIIQDIDHNRAAGTAFYGIGFCFMKLGQYDRALESIIRGWVIAKEVGDKETESDCCFVLAHLYRHSKCLQESLKALEQSLEIAQEIECLERKRRAYRELSDTYYSCGKTLKAIDSLHLSLALSLKNEGNTVDECVTYHNLGLGYMEMGDLKSANAFFLKSAIIAKEVDCLGIEVSAYDYLGHIRHCQGKYNEAIEYRLKMLDLKPDDKLLQAKVYNNLGNTLKQHGKYSDAIKFYNLSMKLHFQQGNEGEASIVYNNLGTVFYHVGRYSEAVKCYVMWKHYSKIWSLAAEKCFCKNMAPALMHTGLPEARGYRLKFIILAVHLGDRLGEIWFYQELAECYGNHDDTENWIKYHEIAIYAAAKTKDVSIYAYVSDELAKCYSRNSKFQDAIKFVKNSLNIYVEFDMKIDQARSLGNLGALHYNLAIDNKGDDRAKFDQFLQQSEEYLRESLQCYNGLYNELHEYEYLKISIIETFVQFSKTLTTVLLETMRINEAFEVLELMRARILGDILITRYQMNAKPLSTSYLQDPSKERNVNHCTTIACTFTGVYPSITFWVLPPNQKTFVCFEHKVNVSRFAKDSIKHINNVVKSTYQLLKVREAVLCEDRSLGMQKYSNVEDVDGYCLDGIVDRLKSASFESSTLSGFSYLKQTSTSIQPDQLDECKNPLQELFKELLTPVQPYLTEDEILIVPEGPLYMVPFAALQDPQTGRFLFETKRIRLAPSLTILKLLEDCPADYHSKTGALVIGNPCVGEVMFRGKKKVFNSLPAAQREAEVISAFLGVEPLTGIHANKDVIKEKLREGSAVIHIAAHGDDSNGEIALAPGISANSKDIPDEEDYILTMKEVQDIGVRAQLVVLSCCHSGRGEIRTEGVIGMSRAFLAAGARAVVASLWAVDDRATLEFMSSFYMYLKFRKSASLSLQKTMKELRESKKYRHPRFWAPFFLIGHDVTIAKI